MKRIFIARHGRTDWNVARKVQGSTDIPLNETGLAQARKLADVVGSGDVVFDEIWHSPLSRAAETARIVGEANNIPLKEERRLQEQDFGSWEGWQKIGDDSSFHEAKKRFVDGYNGGESMLRLAQRVYNLLDELKSMPEDKNILLVTHGGIARFVHSYFNSMTNEEFASFQMENCEVREYRF